LEDNVKYLNLVSRSLYALTLAASLPVLSAATGPVTGSFGITGPGVFVFKTGGADFIRFCTVVDPSCSAAATAQGDLKASGPGTQSFAVLLNTDVGKIDNITDVTPPLAPYTYFPVATPVTIDNWLSIASQPTWNFQANLLPLATCSPTPTQQCIGPFQLDQSGSNVSVFMFVTGTLINTVDNSKSSFIASFTGQYLGTTIAAVAAAAQSPGGILSQSWSASITATAAATGCPATPGFWKNESKHPFPSALTFPVTIGGIAYSSSDFYTILGNSGGGNAVQILGFQLVAAILNIAAGGQTNAATLAAISQANTDLAGINLITDFVAPSSTLGQDMITQAGVLANYNSGFFGTCVDGTGLKLG
jgi:hypothetical protein